MRTKGGDEEKEERGQERKVEKRRITYSKRDEKQRGEE